MCWSEIFLGNRDLMVMEKNATSFWNFLCYTCMEGTWTIVLNLTWISLPEMEWTPMEIIPKVLRGPGKSMGSHFLRGLVLWNPYSLFCDPLLLPWLGYTFTRHPQTLWNATQNLCLHFSVNRAIASVRFLTSLWLLWFLRHQLCFRAKWG